MVPVDPGNVVADPVKRKGVVVLQCMKWFKRYIVKTQTHKCFLNFVGEHHSDFNNLIFCVSSFPCFSSLLTGWIDLTFYH